MPYSCAWVGRRECVRDALDAHLHKGLEVNLDGGRWELKLKRLEHLGMHCAKHAHRRPARGEEDLRAATRHEGRIGAMAHAVGRGLQPEHEHCALDESVDNLEAGGGRVREDDGEAAPIRGAHVRRRVEVHRVGDFEEAPRQRVALVGGQRLEETGQQRRAAHLELDCLRISDDDGRGALVLTPHALERLVVRAKRKRERLRETRLGHLDSHQVRQTREGLLLARAAHGRNLSRDLIEGVGDRHVLHHIARVHHVGTRDRHRHRHLVARRSELGIEHHLVEKLRDLGRGELLGGEADRALDVVDLGCELTLREVWCCLRRPRELCVRRPLWVADLHGLDGERRRRVL
mmetsp:Transcript_31484/g.82253  ORF Transcript_31484/g.82253 Transcript_31484/m.82253 type:complete len:347 (+) Transcript_31484:359-1399(+)